MFSFIRRRQRPKCSTRRQSTTRIRDISEWKRMSASLSRRSDTFTSPGDSTILAPKEKLSAKSITKLGLATSIAALWMIVVPIAGAAADVQISAARAAALKECSRLAARYPTNDWGNADIYLYRSCMVRHGQQE